VIFFALLIGFIFFITLRGELAQYLAVVGLSKGAAAGAALGSAAGADAGAAGLGAQAGGVIGGTVGRIIIPPGTLDRPL
jgi:hypothetical protein